MAREQPGQPRDDAPTPAEVDEPGDGREVHRGVRLVDLPRVEVEDGALAPGERRLDGGPDACLAGEAGGPAAAEHRRVTEEGPDERRNLEDRSRRRRQDDGSDGVGGVPDRGNGEERGVDAESLLDERREVGARGRAQRPLRGAVGRDGDAGGLLEGGPGGPEVGPELLDAHRVRPPVEVAVAGDLVPRPGDPPDEVRVAPRHPSEDEERGLRGGRPEEVEDPLRGRDDARRKRGPLLRDVVDRVAADVEPLFDVDGQDEPGTGHGGEL